MSACSGDLLKPTEPSVPPSDAPTHEERSWADPSLLARHLFVRWPSHMVEAALDVEYERYLRHICVLDQSVCAINDLAPDASALAMGEPPMPAPEPPQLEAWVPAPAPPQKEDAFSARSLVEAIVAEQAQLEDAAARQARLQQCLASHEAGVTDKATFLAAIRHSADRDVLRRAIALVMDGSCDARRQAQLQSSQRIDASLVAPRTPQPPRSLAPTTQTDDSLMPTESRMAALARSSPASSRRSSGRQGPRVGSSSSSAASSNGGSEPLSEQCVIDLDMRGKRAARSRSKAGKAGAVEATDAGNPLSEYYRVLSKAVREYRRSSA
jgi:hypothetical protein